VAELDARIEQILNDPDQLVKVMEIAKQLMGGALPDVSAPSNEESNVSQQASEEPLSASKDALASADNVSSLLSGLNIGPGLSGALARALTGLNKNNKRISLLAALLPFVSDERKDMVHRAMQALKMAGAARAALGDSLGGETRHV
jgi:hypothetical protein